MDVKRKDERVAKAKKAAIMIAKRVGPTATVLILRRMGRMRAASAVGIGFFVLEVALEVRASLKNGRKGADVKRDEPKPDAM